MTKANSSPIGRGDIVRRWPAGDATLKKGLEAGWSRSRISAELTRELKIKVTNDHVANRGKRMGWIKAEVKAAMPKGMVPVTPQRLTAIMASRIDVKPSRTCCQPLWHVRHDENYQRFCSAPCVPGSSWCEEHREINVVKTVPKLFDGRSARF